MFKQSILAVLIGVLLCAILSSAGITTFGKDPSLRHSSTEKPKNSYEDSFEAEQNNDYKHERYNVVDEKDKSEELMYVDPSWLAEEVAKADHVPPPKYVYETTNEKFDRQQPGEISNLQQVQVSEQAENHQLQYLSKNDEESKTSEELEKERLRDLEAQIIPYDDKNDSDNSDKTEKANFIASNEKSSEEMLGPSEEDIFYYMRK